MNGSNGMPAHSRRQTRRAFLVRLAAASSIERIARAQAPRPNFVILFADDLGWGDVGFNGRTEWRTPNLDRIAREGMVAERWYTGYPLCAPSRACLLTGRYSIHHGVRSNGIDLPAGEVTLAEALQAHGYRTAVFGKWHSGRLPGGGFTHPLDQGFQETFGYLEGRHAWEHFPKRLFRGRKEEPVSGYSADLLAAESIRFLKENRQRPFFLYVPFIEPHFYIEAPEEDVARHRGRFAEKDPSQPYNARYAAMIERLDAAVGKILAALDELKLADNTVVLFTSDNGATFEAGNHGASSFHDSNRPFRGQKRSLEEGGIRVPAAIRWPGKIPAGVRRAHPMHMIDVMPSFLAAAGIRPDAAWKLDGADMSEVWAGKSPPPERTLFWEFNGSGWRMRAAMRGDFKLLEIGDNQFLYNVRSDPGERRTLGAEYPEILKQLDAELKAWLAGAVH